MHNVPQNKGYLSLAFYSAFGVNPQKWDIISDLNQDITYNGCDQCLQNETLLKYVSRLNMYHTTDDILSNL